MNPPVRMRSWFRRCLPLCVLLIWCTETSKRKINLLSVDFHISPVHDIKNLLLAEATLKQVVVHDKSLSGACASMNTCARDLRVITRENGMELNPCPHQIRYQFWNEYTDDGFMHEIDAFVCNHALAICELYLPFAKPMFLIASTRYEVGRYSAPQWTRLNKNLVAIAAQPQNILAANNKYDAEYLRHFTGIKYIPVLPSLCMYVGATYSPSRPEILVGPSRLSSGGKNILYGSDGLFSHLTSFNKRGDAPDFVPVRKLYPRFAYSDLAKHPAVVLIPYQVSIMSLFEYYAMAIPVFAPSLELLIKWQVKHLVMDELSWNCVFGNCHLASYIESHPDSPHAQYDPNMVLNATSLRYWLKFADFYQWPGIVYFDNWDDLLEKLLSTDLAHVSSIMRRHSDKQRSAVWQFWKGSFRYLPSSRSKRRRRQVTTGKNRALWTQQILNNYPQLAKDSLTETC